MVVPGCVNVLAFDAVQSFPVCLCCAGLFSQVVRHVLVSSCLSRLDCGLLHVVECVVGGFTLFFHVFTMSCSERFSTCVQLFERFLNVVSGCSNCFNMLEIGMASSRLSDVVFRWVSGKLQVVFGEFGLSLVGSFQVSIFFVLGFISLFLCWVLEVVGDCSC